MESEIEILLDHLDFSLIMCQAAFSVLWLWRQEYSVAMRVLVRARARFDSGWGVVIWVYIHTLDSVRTLYG